MIQLACTVSPGQFSSEYTVCVQSFNGKEFSLFAEKDDVKIAREPSLDVSETGWLSVKIVDQSELYVLVQLPKSTLEGGRMISVNRSQLREASS